MCQPTLVPEDLQACGPRGVEAADDEQQPETGGGGHSEQNNIYEKIDIDIDSTGHRIESASPPDPENYVIDLDPFDTYDLMKLLFRILQNSPTWRIATFPVPPWLNFICY